MRVLVIGAGFGGLCLANGLQKEKGIKVQIFERQLDPSHNVAGYGIHIGADGKRALQRCLDSESFKRFLAATTPTGCQWAFRDTQLGMLALRDDAKLSGRPEAEVERRACHRFEFRDILLKSLKPAREKEAGRAVVHWGKSFTHYEHLSDGRVRAHFSDGTSAEGDILIGADGSKSKVRQQRLPQLQREQLGVVLICGRYQLNEARAKALPKLMTDDSLNNIVPHGKGWLYVASFSAAKREQRHTHAHGPVESKKYTLWAYVVPRSQTPVNAKALSPTQLRDMALSGVRDWAPSPSLITIVRDADLSTVSPIEMQSMPHLPAWESNHVTLLGDAIHNMTPMAGVGANIALRDAHVLTDLLTSAHRDHTSVTDAIATYEHRMRGYANGAVTLSRQVAERASSESWLQRRAFHGVLKSANASPLVMRNTIARGAFED